MSVAPIANPRRYLLKLRLLIVLNVTAALFYVTWILAPGRVDFLPLFILFIMAEMFNVAQVSGYWATVWTQKWPQIPEVDFDQTDETVDIFITVCNEPKWIVEGTVSAALKIDHPRRRVFVLDDSDPPGIEAFVVGMGAEYIARPSREHAKAGNINYALEHTDGDYVVIFDADHVPASEFLKRTLPGFRNEKVAFVQTPQWYGNTLTNSIATGANDQQQLFYGPILRGKGGQGAVFSCGTNVVFRRSALDEVDGIAVDSITEDLSTSINLQQKGWTGTYVPEVLARGLGPEDLGAYTSQQMRWARGGLAVLLTKGVFGRRLKLGQRFQYLLSFTYWFTGPAYLLYLVALIIGLFSGERPFTGVLQYPLHFIPYFLLTLLTIGYSAGGTFTFRAVWMTLCSFPIHLAAIFSTLLRRKVSFVVTPKTVSSQSFLGMTVPHLIFIVLLASGMLWVFLFANEPDGIANSAFALGHIVMLGSFVRISMKTGESEVVLTAVQPEVSWDGAGKVEK